VASRWTLLLTAAASALGAAGLMLAVAGSRAAPERPRSERERDLASRPIDAAQIGVGRLKMERLPEEVGKALEAHSEEIVRTAEALEGKQARITGSCGPGSAIRVISEDGSVSCQRFPKGVVSVTALAAVPRLQSTTTAPNAVRGGVGRYQTGGEDDYLVVPIVLPDGAVVTSFTYVYYDNAEGIDGTAYLYRSDDRPLAVASTTGAADEVRSATSEQIEQRRVDAGRYAYFVYFQVSAQAGAALTPISASVSYRLP
jgi:hypothetical protein